MKKYFAPIILLLGLFACQDVVDIDVASSEPELIVEGVVSDKDSLWVKLSTTTEFFSGDGNPALSGAIVSLWEDGVEATTLVESADQPGYYRSPFIGTVGKSYQLEVEIIQDAPDQILGEWVSEADILRAAPPIDSLNIALLNRNTIPQAFFEGDYALMYFGDLPGEGNHYRIKRSLNDSAFAQEGIVISDEQIPDGSYFGVGLFPPIGIYGPFEEDGDTLTVRLESISEDLRNYLQVLQSQVQTGSPFDAAPALVIGNIHRKGDSSDFAFGYFSTMGVSENGIRYQP